MGKLAKVLGGQSQPGLKMYAKGGSAHNDEAEDRALLRKAVKPSALTGKKGGGRVCKKHGGKACSCMD